MKKYYALYSKIKRRILAGEFEKSNKLPSKRVAADMENVSVVTIEKAYSLLEDEGYIKPCARRGYFVLPVSAPAPSAPEKTARPNPLPLPSLSVSHDFQYSLWIKSARKVLARHGGRLFVRAPAEGCEILRNAISEFLFEYRGFSAPPERIIIGSGAEQLYESVVKLLGRDKIYAVENPSYDKIRAVYSGTGARVNLMDIAGDGIDTKLLEKCGADVLHVTPYRSFPSGVTASVSKRYEYLHWAEQKGRFLVEDDYAGEFFPSGQPREPLAASARNQSVIYINTFSKTLSPSIRIGYMVLPPSLMAVFREKLGIFSSPVPVLDQYVLAEFIGSGNFVRHLNHVRRRLNANT